MSEIFVPCDPVPSLSSRPWQAN